MLRQNMNKVAIILMSFTVVLSACGKQAVNVVDKSQASPEQKDKTATDTAKTSTKYDPPIDLSVVGQSDPNIKFAEGESYDKNGVYDAYAKDLGINIKNKWMVDSKQYEEKVNLSIASGDIPDLMKVNISQLQQLVDNDMIANLSDVFDKYATPDTKKFMMSDNGKEMSTAKFNGKLMAIPVTDSPYNAAEFLWIRKDWLKKLNLPEPKTMQDVLKISEAFTTQDPDGNGKADTYGFVAQQEIYNPVYSFIGIFNGYHAYPGAWIKDSSGKLVYGSIQPEMKAALKTIQDLYKAGQIDKEFFTKDHTKENELVANNQAGMAYGPFWMGSWPMASAVVKDKKVTQDWEVYPLPSVDSIPAMIQIGMNSGKSVVGQGVDGYYVVSKKCKNPEAAIKILNRWIQVDNAIEQTDETKAYHFGKNNQELWKLNPIIVMSQDLNVKTGAVLPKAIESKDPSSVKDNVSGKALYDDVMKYLDGDTGAWSSWMKAKSHGSLEIMNQYLTENRYLFDQFSGAPTPVMADKKSILDQKEQEIYTKIITNQASLDEFDKFVDQWKSLGGDQITKEVNDWYAKKSQ